MIREDACRIDLDSVQAIALRDDPEHALGNWRAADVIGAHEKDARLRRPTFQR
jgi:hypothetical protein